MQIKTRGNVKDPLMNAAGSQLQQHSLQENAVVWADTTATRALEDVNRRSAQGSAYTIEEDTLILLQTHILF